MKIAVIGSGISGLSAAYYLSKKHKVDLFEKENQFGGHANTIKVAYHPNKEIPIDIGFMVFNQKTYPNLINFFLENNRKLLVIFRGINLNYFDPKKIVPSKIEKFLKKASIPLSDIAAQNLRMNEGEKSEKAIKKHAEQWIKNNQSTFDSWIK